MPPTTSDQPSHHRHTNPAVPVPRATESTGPARPVAAPTRPGPPGSRSRAPLAVAAPVAAGLAAVASCLPVTATLGVLRLAEGTAGFGAAARLGLAAWLLGHGVPLETSAGRFGLAPLALSVLAAWRLVRAGVHASRAIGARGSRSVRRSLSSAAAVGLAYGLLGLLAAVVVNTDGQLVSPVRAGATLAIFGALAALFGALRTTGALWAVAHRIPASLRDGIRTGLVAAALLLATGAGAAGLAVATAGGAASDMIAAYHTGVAGQTGITLISVAYAPNAVVWAAAYLLGPGFAVGTDSVVRTTEVTLGALPAVPLLAALPHGPIGGAGAALLAIPAVNGMIAGWLLARRLDHAQWAPDGPAANRKPDSWARLLTTAAAAGPAAGVVLGSVAVASSGPLGDGRLAEIGPVGWQVAAAATVLITFGSLVGAAAGRIFSLSKD